MIQVEDEGDFRVEPVCILDRKVKVLRNKAIGLVKVQWTYYGPEDATWEHKENMREEYPQIVLTILNKAKCKTPFWKARVPEPHLRVLANCVGDLDKENKKNIGKENRKYILLNFSASYISKNIVDIK